MAGHLPSPAFSAGVLVLTLGGGGCGASSEPQGEGGGDGSGGSLTVVEPEAGLGDCPCAPGELDDGQGACQPAGPSLCAEGFAMVGGGCEPVLPDDPCVAGQIALSGETICRDVASCGSGPWGDIPVDADTVYVDGAHGGASDGSEAQPFTSIQQAVDAAPAGATVAVAAGSYAENVVIGQPLTIWGVCPSEVTIDGGDAQPATVTIIGTDDVLLAGLAVTGSGIGVAVANGESQLERLWVHDTGGMGVYVGSDPTPSTVTLTDSLVERATGHGLYGIGATAQVVRSELRDTALETDGTDGRGITMTDSPQHQLRATLTLEGSSVVGNRDYGIRAAGSDVVVRDSLVAETSPGGSAEPSGNGVMLRATIASSERSTGIIERSVILGSQECGLCVYNSDAEIDETTVRRVAEDSSGEATQGVYAFDTGEILGGRPQLTLRRSFIGDVHGCALRVTAGDALIEGVVIRGTQQDAVCQGLGISIEDHAETFETSTATIRGSRIEQVVTYGLLVIMSRIEASGLLVSGVARRDDDTFGRGVSVEASSDFEADVGATVSCSLVERVHETGIAGLGGALDLVSVQVRDVTPSDSTISAERLSAGVILQRSFFASHPPPSLLLDQSEIANVEAVGLALVGGEATVRGSLIHDIHVTDGAKYGDGIAAMPWPLASPPIAAQLDLEQSVIAQTARAGVASFGGQIALGDLLLRCNAIPLVADSRELDSEITDLGGVHCLCEDESSPCKVLSATLEPPVAPQGP